MLLSLWRDDHLTRTWMRGAPFLQTTLFSKMVAGMASSFSSRAMGGSEVLNCCVPMAFLRRETWNTGCICVPSGSCNL